jgi:hypothetical protein
LVTEGRRTTDIYTYRQALVHNYHIRLSNNTRPTGAGKEVRAEKSARTGRGRPWEHGIRRFESQHNRHRVLFSCSSCFFCWPFFSPVRSFHPIVILQNGQPTVRQGCRLQERRSSVRNIPGIQEGVDGCSSTRSWCALSASNHNPNMPLTLNRLRRHL